MSDGGRLTNMSQHTAAEVRALRSEVIQHRQQIVELRRQVKELALELRLSEMRTERRIAGRRAGRSESSSSEVVDVRDSVRDH